MKNFLKNWVSGAIVILTIFFLGFILIKFGLYLEHTFGDFFEQTSHNFSTYLIEMFEISEYNSFGRLIIKIISPFLVFFSPILALGLLLIIIFIPYIIGSGLKIEINKNS